MLKSPIKQKLMQGRDTKILHKVENSKSKIKYLELGGL